MCLICVGRYCTEEWNIKGVGKTEVKLVDSAVPVKVF
jgi:hypothetical protein